MSLKWLEEMPHNDHGKQINKKQLPGNDNTQK